jgi:carotenoid 1,2-hydratase
VSDDRRYAIVVIAMLGNPFSPRYARARRRGVANPLSFCAMNVALYGPNGSLWALTERAVGTRGADGLSIGPSSLGWDGDRLLVDVCERTPWRRDPIEGRITFAPDFLNGDAFALDANGKHGWCPVAPSGALDVRLSSPSLSFRAIGYHDSNAGDEPLEAAFGEWTWSRAHAAGRAVVTYDVVLIGGARRDRALSIGPRGTTDIDLATRSLPPSRWGLTRRARSSGAIVRSLEDTPFYSRDLIDDCGVLAMHETLSLDRFARRAVQFLLPFRMRHA